MCANSAVQCVEIEIIREGQDRTSTISVRSGHRLPVVYYFTHPSADPGDYTFFLRNGDSDIISVEYCFDRGLETYAQEDLVYIHTGSCSHDDSTTEFYLLMVAGNEITNGTIINCVYRHNRQKVPCDSATSATIMVHNEGTSIPVA